MTKYIISIFVILVLISGVGYYGYYDVYQGANFMMETEGSFADLDTGLSEIDAFSLSEDTVLSLEQEEATTTDQKIDNAIKDLDSFKSDSLDSLNVDVENI